MCKILSRIKTLADTEGISIGSIERAIGASRGVISKAITKGTDIQAKWLELICEKFPQYSPVWLLTGEGNMLRGNNGSQVTSTQTQYKQPSERKFTQDTQKLSQNDNGNGLIERFMVTIRDLAEENGRLKERIVQLEREKNDSSVSLQAAPKTLSPSTVD